MATLIQELENRPLIDNVYSRKILLAVTGLSPQIVTETLYALVLDPEQPFVPTEIHLLTTLEGAERARHSLLHEQEGHFHRFCSEYKVNGIAFDMGRVHIIEDADGNPLEDIRTLDDNRSASDAITEHVRELTMDDDSALHVSIAGGRKTMGFYLGYALSLFGREQDRLSHVLVSAPYESHPDFYYPTHDSRLIHTREGNPRAYDTKEATVTLAEIPFVRLRDGLPKRLLEGQASFSHTVATAQRAQRPPELVLDLQKNRIAVSGEVIELTNADMVFYSWMARRASDESGFVRHDDANVASDYLAEYRRVVSEYSAEYENVEAVLRKEMDKNYFDQRKSRTNRALRDALPPQLSQIYEIVAEGRRPATRYGLSIGADKIRYGVID